MRSKKCICGWVLLAFMFLLLINTGCKKENEEPYQVVSDIDGNIYPTIKIGNQVWMAENLRTKRYRNGDSIYHLPDNGKWSQTQLGGWCNYNNDPQNDKTYGKLYNGYAVLDSRNIAPEGWHVPTNAELWMLNVYVSAHTGSSGSLAKALASTNYWVASSLLNTPGNDQKTNNASGFQALPGGFRGVGGSFGYESLEHDGYLWSTDGMIWNLNYIITDVNILNESSLRLGYSVRCIKDY